MQSVHTGQCGLCGHFGENHGKTPQLINIVTTHNADEAFLDDCGHPRHASLHLKVSAISGCDGFVPVASA